MNANELRVGNWVMYSHKHESPLPVAIKIDISDLILIGENLKDYKYEPIVLSPEILEKCGFEVDYVSHYGGWLIKVKGDEKIRIVWDEFIGWHWPMNGYNKPIVNSLHQLQNLYFSLCGEELTYNQ